MHQKNKNPIPDASPALVKKPNNFPQDPATIDTLHSSLQLAARYPRAGGYIGTAAFAVGAHNAMKNPDYTLLGAPRGAQNVELRAIKRFPECP